MPPFPTIARTILDVINIKIAQSLPCLGQQFTNTLDGLNFFHQRCENGRLIAATRADLQYFLALEAGQ